MILAQTCGRSVYSHRRYIILPSFMTVGWKLWSWSKHIWRMFEPSESIRYIMPTLTFGLHGTPWNGAVDT